MAIAERIYFFRNLRGMTQKALGKLIGFPENSADVRIAQYESGARRPKDDVKVALSLELGISPLALTVPDIDTFEGLMHTLFALEDRIGLRIVECNGEAHLRIGPDFNKSAAALNQVFNTWSEYAAKVKSGEMTKEQYDAWRYRYPDHDPFRPFTGILSPELTELLMSEYNKEQKKKRKKK